MCVAGVCRGAGVVCDDGDPCTTEACDGGACVATPLTCGADEVCVDGDCVDLPPDAEPVELGPEAAEDNPEVVEAEVVEAGPEVESPEDGPVEPIAEVVAEVIAEVEGVELTPDADPSDATTDRDGLDFTDTGPQVIGGKDEGCAGGSASSLLLLVCVGLALRRRVA